jgi:polyisoprenoid-binding protein YceI
MRCWRKRALRDGSVGGGRFNRRHRHRNSTSPALTIKSVARPVNLDLTFLGSAIDLYGQLRLGFSGAGTVNGKEWVLTWNVALEAASFVLGDRVTLELDASAIPCN